MSANDVELFFQRKSSVYDAKIRCSIPGYEALHAMTGDFLRGLLPESANVLAVGVGTGMELITLGNANSGWRFTAVDTSGEMLALCEQNVQAAGIPQEEVEADFAMNRKVATFLTEQDYRQVLTDSGFSSIRQFYRAFTFGGWICWKG